LIIAYYCTMKGCFSPAQKGQKSSLFSEWNEECSREFGFPL
jgi:hypothetical protein